MSPTQSSKTWRPPPPPEPDPATLRRSPEQRQRDAAALEREVERMKAAGVDPAPPRPLARAGAVVGDIVAEIAAARQRQEAWMAERAGLPCWRGAFPAGVPDGAVQAQHPFARLLAGRSACQAAGVRGTCRYGGDAQTCLWERASAFREATHTHLAAALGGEAEDEHKLVLQAVDLDAPKPLRETDPMQVVRLWLKGTRGSVTLGNGAELVPLTGKVRYPGTVHLEGGERLLVLVGNAGRGKTTAAIYALGRVGGLYVLEYALGRPFDVDRAAGAHGVLVVDQLQPEDPDEKRRMARRLDELVHRRFAAGRKTLLIGNVDWRAFAGRYGEAAGGAVKHAGVIAERCSQAGAFVHFGGDSLRA